jgi:uncharacterized protein (UPF0210 family)
MKSLLVTAVSLLLLCVGMPLANAQEIKPRIRAVTAFIEVSPTDYADRIADAQEFFAVAQTALNTAGFAGAGGRITTQPFPQYTKGMTTEEAIALVSKMREAATKGNNGLNIGAAMLHDSDDPAAASLLIEILTRVNVNANLITADEDGIHWKSIRQAARVIKQLAERSPHGDANFNFGTISMMKPYGPYYPGSYHVGKGHAFAIAMDAMEVVADVFMKYADPVEAEAHLSAELTRHAMEVEAIGMEIAKATGWTYEGIDATPAPLGERSIAAAIEDFLDAPFGSPGTETATGILTRAVQSPPVKRAGYSGLMLPVMEDITLSQRWAEGTYTMDSIMAYSAVCAAGLDTIPLPGDVTEEQIARILGDLAWLAYKWQKPLAARLLPVPGRQAGELTEFSGSLLNNTKIQPLPGSKR